MNTITDLLDLEDSDIYISETRIEGTRKYLTLETHPSAHYCPCCNYTTHSRGIKQRTVLHPILQDGFELILLVKQRRGVAPILIVFLNPTKNSGSLIGIVVQQTQPT